jgi:hypothetical protein
MLVQVGGKEEDGPASIHRRHLLSEAATLDAGRRGEPEAVPTRTGAGYCHSPMAKSIISTGRNWKKMAHGYEQPRKTKRDRRGCLGRQLILDTTDTDERRAFQNLAAATAVIATPMSVPVLAMLVRQWLILGRGRWNGGLIQTVNE